MEAQGFNVDKNIIYQDNKRKILLEEDRKKSSIKRTREINICCLFMADQI